LTWKIKIKVERPHRSEDDLIVIFARRHNARRKRTTRLALARQSLWVYMHLMPAAADRMRQAVDAAWPGAADGPATAQGGVR
jgi:hypothetical protein